MVDGGHHAGPEAGRFHAPGALKIGHGIVSSLLFGKKLGQAQQETEVAKKKIEENEAAKKAEDAQRQKAKDRRNSTRRQNTADAKKREADLKHYEDKRGLKRKHDELDRQARAGSTPQQPVGATTTVPTSPFAPGNTGKPLDLSTMTGGSAMGKSSLLNPTQQANAVAPASAGAAAPTRTPRPRKPRASTASTASTPAAPAAPAQPATTSPAFKADAKPGVPKTTGIMSRFDANR
jgi:hypothetical protein